MAKPALLFAPGAGAPSSSAWMVAWKERLSTFADVTMLDYPYMLAGRKAPDRLPTLVAAHREVLAMVTRRTEGSVFLIGKSMGGRVGCHVAVEESRATKDPQTTDPQTTDPQTKDSQTKDAQTKDAQTKDHVPAIAGVICMGYPLVGANGSVRDEVLLALSTPILFIQGTRDPLCPLARLDAVRPRMTAPNELFTVDGGNHSLELLGGKKNARAQDESTRSVLDAIRGFVLGRAT